MIAKRVKRLPDPTAGPITVREITKTKQVIRQIM